MFLLQERAASVCQRQRAEAVLSVLAETDSTVGVKGGFFITAFFDFFITTFLKQTQLKFISTRRPKLFFRASETSLGSKENAQKRS